LKGVVTWRLSLSIKDVPIGGFAILRKKGLIRYSL